MFELYFQEVKSGKRSLWGLFFMTLAIFICGVIVLSSVMLIPYNENYEMLVNYDFSHDIIWSLILPSILAVIAGVVERSDDFNDFTRSVGAHYCLSFLIASVLLMVSFAGPAATDAHKWAIFTHNGLMFARLYCSIVLMMIAVSRLAFTTYSEAKALHSPSE
ncbi:MAG: hypothetical protein AAF429_12285 [Pseudomonadota bacterium]